MNFEHMTSKFSGASGTVLPLEGFDPPDPGDGDFGQAVDPASAGDIPPHALASVCLAHFPAAGAYGRLYFWTLFQCFLELCSTPRQCHLRRSQTVIATCKFFQCQRNVILTVAFLKKGDF